MKDAFGNKLEIGDVVGTIGRGVKGVIKKFGKGTVAPRMLVLMKNGREEWVRHDKSVKMLTETTFFVIYEYDSDTKLLGGIHEQFFSNMDAVRRHLDDTFGEELVWVGHNTVTWRGSRMKIETIEYKS